MTDEARDGLRWLRESYKIATCTGWHRLLMLVAVLANVSSTDLLNNSSGAGPVSAETLTVDICMVI
jgi:hypothetical protein